MRCDDMAITVKNRHRRIASAKAIGTIFVSCEMPSSFIFLIFQDRRLIAAAAGFW